MYSSVGADIGRYMIVMSLFVIRVEIAYGQDLPAHRAEDVQENEVVNIETEELDGARAIEAALQQLGLMHYDASKANAERISLTMECVPFIGEAFNGQETWKVELRDVDLARDSGLEKAENPHLRTLVVILAPGKPQVLRVASVWPDGVARIATYPSAGEQARQLKAISVAYLGTPDEPPTVTLLAALTSSDAMFWSAEVKQIYAVYVRASSVKYADKDIWAFDLRGFRPFHPPVPPGANAADIPEDARNHMRETVDARTGEWLGAGTTPQPGQEERELPPIESRY